MKNRTEIHRFTKNEIFQLCVNFLYIKHGVWLCARADVFIYLYYLCMSVCMYVCVRVFVVRFVCTVLYVCCCCYYSMIAGSVVGGNVVVVRCFNIVVVASVY